MFLRRTLIICIIFFISTCGGSGGGESSPDPGDSFCTLLGVDTKFAKKEGVNLRIINGEECSDTNSSVVKLTIITFSNQVFTCSGTMITPTHVITAGHCIEGNIKSVFADVRGVAVPATHLALHPSYSEKRDRVNNDVAILLLKSAVNLPTVPLLINNPTAPGDKILIYGYGQDENFSSTNNTRGVLRGGKMEVESSDSQHLSAKFDGDGQNTCLGDSGGPAMKLVNGRVAIVGLTSSGALESCGKGDVSLFANTQGESIFNFIVQVAPDVEVL